ERLGRLGECDPRVKARILLGAEFPAADYVALRELRAAAAAEFAALAAPFDAVVMPTVACVAPPIAAAGASDEDYARWNLRILRNPAFVNFVDGCAASLPCHEPGAAPIGFSVCGPAMSDRHVLAAAAAVERALSRH
ncbi:MAG: amidase family protein, partial [Betaproteobacteria bacterium]